MRRRPVVFALPIALGLAASLAYVFLAPKTYVAKASIQVLPVVSDQYGSVNLANVINMATEQQIAQSSDVVDLAAKSLQTTDADIQDSVSVDSPQDTQVLNVRYTASNADRAARGAEAVANAYLDNRKAATVSDANVRLARVQDQIKVTQSQLAAKNGDAVHSALSSDLQSLYSQRRQLTNILTTPVAHVITHAAVPTAPTSPRLGVDVPLGLAAGLIAGLVLAVVLPVPEAERQQVAARRRVTTPRRARDGRGKPTAFDEMLAAAPGRLVPPSAAPSTTPLGVSVVPGLAASPAAKAPADSQGPNGTKAPEAPAAPAARVPVPAPAPAISNDAPVAPAAAAPAAPAPAAPPAPAPVAAPAPAPAPVAAPAAPAPAPVAEPAVAVANPAPARPFPFAPAPSSLFEPVVAPAPPAPQPTNGANGSEHPNGAPQPDAPTVTPPADREPAEAPGDILPAAAAPPAAEPRPAPIPQ